MKTIQSILFVSILFFAELASAQSNKAITYLDNMQKKYKSLAGFTANFSLDLGDGEPMVGEISVMGNNYKLKMGGQEIFNNGVEVATYFKELNEVTITEYDAEEDELSPAKIYNLNKNEFSISLIKEDASSAQIQLVPKKSQSISKIVLTLDKNNSNIRSWVLTEKSGDRQIFKVTKMNTQVKLTKSLFEFNSKSHPGVDINDLR